MSITTPTGCLDTAMRHAGAGGPCNRSNVSHRTDDVDTRAKLLKATP